jgi:protein-tyrosine phosphatase
MTYKSLLSCSYNTRELGGFRTSDGRITNNNIFWRSDAPSQQMPGISKSFFLLISRL